MSEERGTTAVPTEIADERATRDGRAGQRAGDQLGEQAGDPSDGPAARPATFRAVPTVALVAIGFLALCLSPIAFQGGPWFLLFLIPVAGAVWVVRSRTRVDAEGLHVRRFVGTRSLAWSEVTTLRLVERGWVHAVPREGADLELRGVRIRDLGRVGEASGGRISVPTPADAAAAAEHARELEAARMRVARLRDQQSAADADDADPDTDTDGADTHTADAATTDAATTDALRADGGGVGGLDADRRIAAGGNDDNSDPTSGNADAATARPEDRTDGDGTTDRS